MLNGSMINSHPLNGSPTVALVEIVPPAPPTPTPAVPVVPGQPVMGYVPGAAPAGFTYRWTLQLLIGGVDVTANLSGAVVIDREEGAAGIASFDLFYPVGTPVPVDLLGDEIVIYYVTETGGVTSEARRYTGFISEPAWDPSVRLMRINCSDRLQWRVEAMAIEDIDTLVGGLWSADLFEAVEGRSRWDYALERLSTRTASLECSRLGEVRVSDWYAQAPAFVFAPGSTVYQSAAIELAQLSTATNRVEIEFSYRYSRLWQQNQTYTWIHPGTSGIGGIGGFCAYRGDSSELPTTGMVSDAVEGAGQTLISGSYNFLPPTLPDPCGTGAPWINPYGTEELFLSGGWTGARRWVQAVTETYKVVLATAAGLVEGSQTISRDSASIQVDDPLAEKWESDPIKGGLSSHVDLPAEARRVTGLAVQLHQARAEIVAAHRRTVVSWAVPTSQVLDCDLIHTLELQDGLQARGKCCRLVDSFDLLSGAALTTLSIAIMRGGGDSDPLAIPASPDTTPDVPDTGGGELLPTQLGGRFTSPPYDETLDGFSGQYDLVNDLTLPVFPRALNITADEIPERLTDEHVATAELLIRVGIPNDLLEL